MIKPVSRTKDPKLVRVVLRPFVSDQPFPNSMLVEYSFEIIDDNARADRSLECARHVLPRGVDSLSLSCWRLDVPGMAHTS